MSKTNIKAMSTLAALSVAFLGSINTAQADSWSLGAAVAVSPNPYRETTTKVMPLPMINYESDTFYIRGLSAGYHLWNSDSDTLSLNVIYSPMHFDPDDSNNNQMRRLDKRRSTLLAGTGYTHRDSWGMIRTQISADVLNNSNGWVGDAAYLYAFNMDALRIVPGIGMRWSSKKQNDYYYGVSSSESRRSGFDRYEAGSSWSPYLELTTRYQINQSWSAFVSGNYTRLSNTVKDSPMVSKSFSTSAMIGASYTF